MNYEISCVPYFILNNNKYYGYLDVNIKTKDIINKKIKLVIDVSGSMTGDKIKQVKQSYKNLVIKLKNTNILLSLIIFNNKSTLIYEDYIIDDDNYLDIIVQGDNKLCADGGTIRLPALELALSNKYDNYDTHIIIFTDGEDSTNKSKLYEKFTNETLHACGIGKESLKLMNNIAQYAKMKTINIIDNVEDIETVLTNLLKYMATNIPDILIINETYHQILNNTNKRIPIDPIHSINYDINIKVKNNNKKICCTIDNVKIFNVDCIDMELSRLLINFNEKIGLHIMDHNLEEIKTIIFILENDIEILNNLCIINSYDITTLLNHGLLVTEIIKIKETIENISTNQYSFNSISEYADRQMSQALTARSMSLI